MEKRRERRSLKLEVTHETTGKEGAREGGHRSDRTHSTLVVWAHWRHLHSSPPPPHQNLCSARCPTWVASPLLKWVACQPFGRTCRGPQLWGCVLATWQVVGVPFGALTENSVTPYYVPRPLLPSILSPVCEAARCPQCCRFKALYVLLPLRIPLCLPTAACPLSLFCGRTKRCVVCASLPVSMGSVGPTSKPTHFRSKREPMRDCEWRTPRCATVTPLCLLTAVPLSLSCDEPLSLPCDVLLPHSCDVPLSLSESSDVPLSLSCCCVELPSCLPSAVTKVEQNEMTRRPLCTSSHLCLSSKASLPVPFPHRRRHAPDKNLNLETKTNLCKKCTSKQTRARQRALVAGEGTRRGSASGGDKKKGELWMRVRERLWQPPPGHYILETKRNSSTRGGGNVASFQNQRRQPATPSV
jgi:hypothetical protein